MVLEQSIRNLLIADFTNLHEFYMRKCARAPYAAIGLTKFWMEKSSNNKPYIKVSYSNGGFNSTRLLETFTKVESQAESKAKKKHKLRP